MNCPCIHRKNTRIGINNLVFWTGCHNPILTKGVANCKYITIENPLVCMDCKHREEKNEDSEITENSKITDINAQVIRLKMNLKSTTIELAALQKFLINKMEDPERDNSDNSGLEQLKIDIKYTMNELVKLQKSYRGKTGFNYKPPC